jgi:site-specific recombinase XerD
VAIRLEDLLASFRRHLRAAAKAPRTIELYGQSVEYFSRWLTDRGRPATLEELTRHAISAWLAELAETCEPSTVGTRLRGMRRFCRWLVTEGELEVAPTDGSPPRRTERVRAARSAGQRSAAASRTQAR